MTCPHILKKANETGIFYGEHIEKQIANNPSMKLLKEELLW